MKRKLGIILPILGVIILTLYFYARSSSSQKNSVVYSQLMKLNEVKTNQFKIDDLRGNYFLVHFWAKWCEPCADEIPVLVNFAKTAKLKRPLKVVAISLDPTLEDAKQILPQKGEGLPPNFILVLDPDHHVAEAMGSFQYPETYFVDPNGKIIEKWIGPQKWEKPEVAEFFNRQMI